jgi:hypothetical protein
MVADLYFDLRRNNIVAAEEQHRNTVAVIRNRHVVADRFDMTPIKML